MSTSFLLPNDLIVSTTNTKNIIYNKILELEKNGRVLFIFYDLNMSSIPTTITSNTFTRPSYIIYGNTINLNTLRRPISNFPTLFNSISYDTRRNYAPSGAPYKTITGSTMSASRTDCTNTNTCTGFYESGGMNTSYSFYNFSLDNITNIDAPETGIVHIKRNTRIGAYGVKIFAYITIPQSSQYRFFVTINDRIRLFINSFLILNSIETNTLSNSVYLSAGTYLIYIEKVAMSTDNDLNISVEHTPQTTKVISPIDSFIIHNYTLINNAINSRDNAIKNYCKGTSNLFLSNSICSNSLEKTDLLNNSVDTYCFEPTINLNLNTKKLNDNCKNIITSTDTKFNNNLKIQLKNNYKKWANKVVTDNQINNNYEPLLEYIDLLNPNETDFPFVDNIKNTCETNLKNKEFDIINQNTDLLCKKIYNRIYSSANQQNINKSIQQIKNNFCDPNQAIQNINDNKCLTEFKSKDDLSNALGQYCFPNGNSIRSSNGLFDNNCKQIYELPDLHVNTKANLSQLYNNWAKTTINTASTNNKFNEQDSILNEYVISQKPSATNLFIDSNNITNYCQTQIGDKFQADNNQNNLCNTLYSSPIYNNDTNIKKSIDNIKNNYCNKIIDSKVRYETDVNCKPEYSNLLKDTIKNRCIKNGTFQYSDNWCTNLSNDNINNINEPYISMSKSRTNDLQKEINTVLVKNYENNKILNNNNYDYALNYYSTIPDSNKKISDELLNQKLFDYCENIEPNFANDANSQCKGIYDKYKDNISVKTSKNKIQNRLCQLPNNISTENPDDGNSNAYNCKSTIFDTDNNLDKYASVVNSYCEKDNNITTEECQSYYNNIEEKILNSLNLKIKPVSQFVNNTEDINNYEDKIELSGFNNGDIIQEYSSEVENLKLMSNDDNYDIINLFLLLIFFIIITYLIYSCKCIPRIYKAFNKKKNNNNQE